jgi:hypothetical protein
MAWRVAVAVLAASACLVSCGTSMAQSRHAPGQTDYIYACGGWFPAEPRAAVEFFDVFGCSGDVGPTDVLRQAVIQAGGRIVHEFNVGAVRAKLRVSQIPGLVSQVPGLPPACAAFSVAQINRYPVDAIVGFRADVTEDDRAFLVSVGATIVSELKFVCAVNAIVPDEAIPEVRAHPSVRYLEWNGIGCLLDGRIERQVDRVR